MPASVRARARAAAVASGLALGALVLGACDDERRAVSRENLPAVADPVATVVVGATIDPDSVAVTVGDSILIVAERTVRLQSETGAYDTATLLPGDRTIIRFTEAGTATLREVDRAPDAAPEAGTVGSAGAVLEIVVDEP